MLPGRILAIVVLSVVPAGASAQAWSDADSAENYEKAADLLQKSVIESMQDMLLSTPPEPYRSRWRYRQFLFGGCMSQLPPHRPMRSTRTVGLRPRFVLLPTHFVIDQSRDCTSASHAIDSAPRCGPRSQRENRGHDSFSPWRCVVQITADNGGRNLGVERAFAHRTRESLPMLLTVDEAATLLRTTRRAIYAMIERRQLPAVVRIRRRVLFRADDLLHWLDQKRAPSPEE